MTDFGLARRALPGEAELTHAGAIIGTPSYMSPEQARGDTKAVGPAADVYALGVILYELLTGRRPFLGPVGEVIGQVLHVEPAPPSQVRPGVDPRLEAVCLRAMAKDQAARYANMREFAAALADCARDPATDSGAAESTDAQLFGGLTFDAPPKAPTPKATARPPRPPRWAWAAGCAAILALGGGTAYLMRTPAVPAVLIDTGLDLTDRSLSFALDGKPISAQALARPVAVTAGEHELVVRRDGRPFRTFRVTVGREPGKAADVTDVSPPAVTPPPKSKPEPAVTPPKSKPEPAVTPPKSKPEPVAIPADGFTPLFNGKDLTGWKVHQSLDEVPWSVEDGALTCTSKYGPNVLFTERGDYRDVHVRVECKFNGQGGGALGGGGLLARAPFTKKVAAGYQAQIGAAKDGNLHALTGSLRVDEYKDAVSVPQKLVQPDTWATVELIVRGFHCTVKVNGEQVVDYEDAGKTWPSGHIGLQFRTPFAGVAQVVWFRKVEVKELPAAP